MANFLGGAMRALSRSPKTAKFVDTLNHADLPRGWSSDPEIVRMASDAWEDMGIQSPFFRSYYRNSALVGPDGLPLPMYHGSRVEGLDYINPDASRLTPVEGGGVAFSVSHPGTTLAYLAKPHKGVDDAGFAAWRENLKDALLHGESLRLLNPDTGRTEFVYMSRRAGDFERPGAADEYAGRILRSLDAQDYRRNLRDLSMVHDAMQKDRELAAYHVPQDALLDAASSHHAYRRFAEDNDDVLPDADAFSNPAMGQIYPVYVNAERPLVVQGDDRSGMRDWFRVGDMQLDRKYLFPDEIERLDSLPVNICDVLNGADTPRRLYPSVDYSGNATDNLGAYLRLHTNHDALVSKGVYDGGGHDVPPSTVAAVFSSNQMKDAYRNVGTFDPALRDMTRAALPYAVSGGALAAAMGAPSSASASILPDGWVPPSAKAELQGMEPSGWMDPVNWLVDAATAGSGLAFRTGQAALGAAQDWIGEHVPPLPEVPEEHYEAAQ